MPFRAAHGAKRSMRSLPLTPLRFVRGFMWMVILCQNRFQLRNRTRAVIGSIGRRTWMFLQIAQELLGHEIDQGFPVTGFAIMAALLIGARLEFVDGA